jgi:hypothetical protein
MVAVRFPSSTSQVRLVKAIVRTAVVSGTAFIATLGFVPSSGASLQHRSSNPLRTANAGSLAPLHIRIGRALPRVLDPLHNLRAASLAGDRHVGTVLIGPSPYFPALDNNVGVGDCSVVAVASIEAAANLRRGRTVAPTTTTSALLAWHSLNGDTALGVSDATLLNEWSSPSGLLRSRITGWTSLDVGSQRQLKSAIVQTGALYASVIVPDDIGWSNLVWSARPAPSSVTSAHAVAVIGWTPSALIAVSWGEVVLIPWTYWTAEGVSAYAVTLR